MACRSENQIAGGSRGAHRAGKASKNGPGRGRSSPRVLSSCGPVETACAHCRTRHILVPAPGGLRRIAPLEEVGRRGVGRRYRGGLAVLLLAASAAAFFYVPPGAAGRAVTFAVLALAVLVSLWLLLRAAPGGEGFRTLERGLEVRGADGRARALIPWEKIRAAEYRLLLGKRMALWLAVEGADGTVPAAPLVAETGIALFTRSRAMPQFLLSLAGRLGERAPFLLPILTVNSLTGARLTAQVGAGLPVARANAPGSRALRSGAAPELIRGALSDEALARSLAEPGV